MRKCKVLAVPLLLAALAGFALTQGRSSLQKHAAFAGAVAPAGQGTGPGLASAHVAIDYARLPLQFEANQGQADPRVKFLARGSGYTLFLTAGEAVLSLQTPSARSNVILRLALAGSNPRARVEGLDRQPGVSNYFIGNDPRRWRTGVPNYARVRYRSVYPGVDLVYYGNQRQLEYDFVIAPGADPRAIELLVSGAQARLDLRGDLQLEAAGGKVALRRPLIYQEDGRGRRAIASGYALRGDGRVGFRVGPYDPAQPLVIDPTLLYSTYLGGSFAELAGGIVIDSAGSAYLTGSTQSTNFPVTGTVPGPTLRGAQAAYVTKLSAAGSSLVYSTFVGGSNSDTGLAIALDSNHNVYVTGNTISGDFPLVKPFQSKLNGTQNAFVFKLNATGSALVYSTYLGGSSTDTGNGIAVDGMGEAVVVGQTNSTNFPTATPLQSALKGPANAFISKLKADGSGLVFSTYLGGSGTDSAAAVASDTPGNAYITGSTSSSNFPTMTPFQANLAGGGNAFVTKINPGGTALAYSTYLGGSGTDQGSAITIDGTGDAFLTGTTTSSNFPKSANAFQRALAGNSNAFVTELNPSGTGLVYSTYLGGTSGESGFAIGVDPMGNAYITGQTRSANFPTLHAFEPALTSAGNAFVTELQSGGSALVYSTYLGGTGIDFGAGIAVDSMGNAFVTGTTQSVDFPVVSAEQRVFGGGSDAFVAKITHTASPGALVSPMSLVFPDTMMGMQSAAKMFTLSNQGDAALTISQVQLTGTNSGDFAQTNTCGSSLAAGANCTFSVTFKPTAGGTRTAVVTITDSAIGSPRNVVLSGNGIAPTPTVSLFPAELVFSGTAVGQKSQPQPVTLTNNGTGALTISSIQFQGTAKNDFSQTNDCGMSVAINATCKINVVFAPSATGERDATMAVNDNAANSPQSVTLIGGESFVVFASPSTITLNAGSTGVSTVFVEPGLGFNQTVKFSCTGNPSGSSCVFNPTSVTLDGTNAAQTQITVTTTARSIGAPVARWLPPAGFRVPLQWLVLLAALATLALRLAGTGRRARLRFAAAFMLIALAAGCGGGGSGTGGTPAGTFNITINGTAGSLTEKGTLVLIVN